MAFLAAQCLRDSKARQEGRASDLVDQGGSAAHEDVLIIRQTQVTLSPLIIHYS